MNRILLLGINARYTHSNLAIRYLRNYLSKLDLQILLLETSINSNTLNIVDKILNIKPDLIAISVYIWNHELVKKLIPELHLALPKSGLILGGPEVSYTANIWFDEFPYLDHIICGPGEDALLNLLKNPDQKYDQILKMSNQPLDQLPFPYREDDFPELLDKYLYYESSRGCSFKCSFCLSSRNDQKYEIRNLEIVKNELRFMLKKNPLIIKFVDRTFNLEPERAREIWRYLFKIWNHKTKFHFEIRPELLGREDIALLEKIPDNMFRFEIGVQSVNKKTLKAINRFQDFDSIAPKILKLIKLGNIHIHVDLIAGLPYEDLDSLKNTFNRIYRLGANNLQFGFLKILFGTQIASETKKYGYLFSPNPPYHVIENKWISVNEMADLRNFEHIFSSYYNSENMKISLENLVDIYDDPFRFYQELTQFINPDFELPKAWNWTQKGELLLRFVNKIIPEKKALIKDCLRWDWCWKAKSHRYPDFIQELKDSEIKKTGKVKLNSFIIDDFVQSDNVSFPKKLINRCIFFKPFSKEFINKYLPDHELVCFFPTDSNKGILYL